ncbi:MAG: BACON domain-containing protein [Bacteroidales bacterium]|nr:BACON domain-containing protein [Bacteroidales bacterium]
MKHIHYLLLCCATLLLAGCETAGPTDEEILNSRVSTAIDVHYSMAGSPVTALSFDHKPSRYTLDVDLNDPNLRWTLESDRDWCKVVSQGNRGPGAIAIDIASNEDFEAREEATLTFVAGEYRGFRIKVNQSAAAFVLGQPFFIAPMGGGSFTCNVTTPSGVSWDIESESWLNVSREGGASASGEYSSQVIKIDVAADSGTSRYGTITLKSPGGTGTINVFQFGNEYKYDADGNLLLPGTESKLNITVPRYMVAGMDVPEFASYEVTDGEGDTATLTISLGENFSDCSENRSMDAVLKLANSSATQVALPTIVQEYTAAHGLVTAKGLMAFAKAVSSGQSTAEWEKDGVVVVVGDINMYDVTDWPGIGTSKAPFTGKFDGGGHNILNLRSTSHGLFNYTKGATIQNITLGKGSSLFNDNEFVTISYFGGIVSRAESTTISACGMACDMEFGGSGDDDAPIAYVGGVVGWADKASVIEGAKMNGKVTISSPSAADAHCYVGGIAGLCEGTLTAAEVLGQVNFSAGTGHAYIGGIEAALIDGATVGNNSFMGTVNLGGNAELVMLGGLYGRIDSDRSFDVAGDKSVQLGTININSFRSAATSCIYVGGFAGMLSVAASLTLRGYEVQTNINIDCASSVKMAKYLCVGGLLGACDPAQAAASLTFDKLVTAGTIKVKYDTAVACQVRRIWLGGVAGYVNGPASFKDCSNKGEVGKYEGGTYCARSNGYGEISGGIAGYAHGGDVSFEGCINQGNVSNHQYNNNGVTGVWDGMYTPLVAGGILGAFNYGTTVEPYTLTITSCTNGKDVLAYRGYTGGIVGFCVNAKISNCNNIGRLSNGSSDLSAYRGGIAGSAGNAQISNCTATCDILAKVYGSADYGCAGGILGIAREGAEADKVVVDGCSFFGSVKADKVSTDKAEYPGGIVGLSYDGCTVSNCKFGGNIQGVEISENNVAANAVGNGKGVISGIGYWGGN